MKANAIVLVIFALFSISREAPAQVRYADSVIAVSSEYSPDGWSAKKALGPPNVYPECADNSEAWVSLTPDDQREFLELHYPAPTPIRSIAVYETWYPGSVDTVYVRNQLGEWQIVWSGAAAAANNNQGARVFIVTFPLTSFNVSDVRIALNSPAVGGWNEIDAVGISSAPIIVNHADLTVTQVQAPSLGSSGHNIQVDWVVENTGDAGTTAFGWTDQIVLSPDTALDMGNAIPLGSFMNPSYLNKGESYSNSTMVTLPEGLTGDYYLIVVADVYAQQPEISDSNNAKRSPTLIHINLTPPPDLIVSSVNAPANVFSGQRIDVSWSVKNNGPGASTTDRWFDYVYISRDSLLFGWNSTFLGFYEHRGVILPDSSYIASLNVQIPDTIYGTRYIFVYTDRLENLYEHLWEGNNIGRTDSFQVTLSPPPDLTVTNVVLPPTGNSGQSIDIGWTVQNQGPASPRDTAWQDRMYLSTLPTFNIDSCVPLRTVATTGTLPPNSSYAKIRTVTLPDGISGQFYVYVQTDVNNEIFEHLYESNNVRRSDTSIQISLSPWPDLQVAEISAPLNGAAGNSIDIRWIVRNTGSVAPSAPLWVDSIFVSASATWDPALAQPIGEFVHVRPLPPLANDTPSVRVKLPPECSDTNYLYVKTDAGDLIYEHTGEHNNTGRSPAMKVQPYPTVDLIVDDLVVPPSASSGQPATFQWRVANIGSAITLTSDWDDLVYLSPDTVLDPATDVLLAAVHRAEGLGAGEYYLRNQTAVMPNGISGNFYLFVVADTGNQARESNILNNIRRSINPISVTLSPSADLEVIAISIPAQVMAGQPLTLGWTVLNTGLVSTSLYGWYDAIYLSIDATLDPSDRKIGTESHVDILSPDSSAAMSAEISIPDFISGYYNLIVQTDSRDDIYEHNGEGNNIRIQPVYVNLSPFSDLVVTSVSIPDSVTPGDTMTVSWTLRNQDTILVDGWITDGIYLSTDTMWSINDPLISTAAHYVSLVKGGSVAMTVRVDPSAVILSDSDGTITTTTPGAVPGQYHVIVRTDIRNSFRERNENNNARASTGTLAVDFPSLQLDVPYGSSIASSQARFFSIFLNSGKDYRITLDGQSATTFNELYVSRNAVPSRSTYDYGYENQNWPDQEIVVSNASAGTYYLMLFCRYGDTSSFTLRVRELLFEIDSVAYTPGGIDSAAEITLDIYGARFADGATVRLRRSGFADVDAQRLNLSTSTHLVAGFSTEGLAPGIWDVVVRNPGGSEAVRQASATLERGEKIDFDISFDLFEVVRVSTPDPIRVKFRNRSNVNIQTAVMFVEMRPAGLEIADDPIQSDSRPFNMGEDTYINDDGRLSFALVFHNIGPYRTKTLLVTATPPDTGRYDISTRTYVMNHELLDTILAGAIREGLFQGWMARPENAGVSVPIAGESNVLFLSTGGCPESDDPVSCSKFIQGRNELNGFIERSNGIARGRIDLVPYAVAPAPAMAPMSVSRERRFLPMEETVRGRILGWIQRQIDKAFDYGLPTGPPPPEPIPRLCLAPHCRPKAQKRELTHFNAVKPLDPNDLTGPPGAGDRRWVSVNQTLTYAVHFENDPLKASAPAQRVTVSVPLDSSLDARTFRLGDFGFGSFRFTHAGERSFHTERLDVRDSLGLYVDVTAGIDVNANRAFWTFVSVNPATGLPPGNPLSGFLPVNDAQHHGEGFANFSVRPKSTSHSGDNIRMQAGITFDVNEPLSTQSVVHTIDAGNPVSSVRPLPASTSGTVFDVRWSGTDDPPGSGVYRYSIYVSKNSGSFTPWLIGREDTSAQFTGVAGNTYSFFSIARDLAGNSEPMKSTADASTIVTDAGDKQKPLPKEFALRQNYPNPFNPLTIIEYAVPISGFVSLKVYDVVGREVATLVDEIERPGVYTLNWNAGSLATGVYFYRLVASHFVETKKLVLIK